MRLTWHLDGLRFIKDTASHIKGEYSMKYSLVVVLFVSCAITLALGAWAQDAASKEHSMTGCLAKGTAPGSYQLTDLEKGPKSVGNVSSTADLAPPCGQKVEITGTAVPPKDSEMDPNVPNSPRYMKTTGVTIISTRCPYIFT